MYYSIGIDKLSENVVELICEDILYHFINETFPAEELDSFGMDDNRIRRAAKILVNEDNKSFVKQFLNGNDDVMFYMYNDWVPL